jgi:hypothetical protein
MFKQTLHISAPDLPLSDDAATRFAATLCGAIKRFGQRIGKWAEARADRYAAAATYEQLSTLSDGELMRRGLSRATLAHDVDAAFERSF